MRSLKRLTMGDIVAGACSILLVALAFTKTWASYNIEAFGSSTSEGASVLDGDAFGALPKLAIFLAVVAGLVTLVRAATDGPEIAPMIYVVTGGLALLLMVITAISGPEDLSGAIQNELPGIDLEELGELTGLNITRDRGIMLSVGPVLAGGILVGGLIARRGPRADAPAAPVV